MGTGLYSARRAPHRPGALLAVVGLHLAGIWALHSVGVLRQIAEEAPRMAAVFIDPPKEQRPDPPPVSFQPVPATVRPDRLPIPDPVFVPDGLPAAPNAPAGVVADPPPTPPGPQAVGPEPVRTPLTWTARRSTDDFYPPASIRMEEQGAAIIRVCVNAAGRLDGKPQVETSSGHARLDAAAVEWARQALSYRPATVDGVPVAACKGFRVSFTLR